MRRAASRPHAVFEARRLWPLCAVTVVGPVSHEAGRAKRAAGLLRRGDPGEGKAHEEADGTTGAVGAEKSIVLAAYGNISTCRVRNVTSFANLFQDRGSSNA